MGAAATVARAMARLHNGVVIPYYERLLAQAYSQIIRPGQTVFDVGANVGLHLERFAALVGPQGRVIAFEPIPGLARALAARFRDNSAVTVKPLALSKNAGTATFAVVENGLEQSGLRRRDYDAGGVVLRMPSNWIAGGILRRAMHAGGRFSLGRWAFARGWVVIRDVAVTVDTIDAQAAGLPRLDYIKIDVEGAEMDCLRGAEATVARCRPLISLEYGRSSYSVYGEQATTLYDWARQHRYLVSDLFGNLVEDEAEWLNVCDVSYWDFFLVPEERRDFWTATFSA
jgi:FkbM family methyltransferase